MLSGDTVHVGGDIPFDYGYGWATIPNVFDEPVVRHAGLVQNGTSCLFLMPESGLGVAIATNMNDYFVANNLLDEIGWEWWPSCLTLTSNRLPQPIIGRHIC